MNHLFAFDSPFLLGFDHVRGLVERAAKASVEAYPPYNVEDRGGGRVRIALGVAGFTAAQLAVTVQANQLTITGKRDLDDADKAQRTFLHRGIAARGFVRGFVVADGLEVEGAALADGLLHVDLSRPAASAAVRNIPILTAG